VGEEEEEGGESEKMNAEKVVEMREREKGLLAVEGDGEEVARMVLHGYFVNGKGQQTRVALAETQHCIIVFIFLVVKTTNKFLNILFHSKSHFYSTLFFFLILLETNLYPQH